jgi:hypothetical protein
MGKRDVARAAKSAMQRNNPTIAQSIQRRNKHMMSSGGLRIYSINENITKNGTSNTREREPNIAATIPIENELTAAYSQKKSFRHYVHSTTIAVCDAVQMDHFKQIISYPSARAAVTI